MEKKKETTIVSWGLYWDNGGENGNYYSILGLYWDNGKMETTIVYWGYIGIMEKTLKTTMVSLGYIGIREDKMEYLLQGIMTLNMEKCTDHVTCNHIYLR